LPSTGLAYDGKDRSKDRAMTRLLFVFAFAGASLLAGCVVAPYPYPYPATTTRRQVLVTRDINKMFTGLVVAESVLLKSNTRETLLRRL
jgi:hypothetical protein